MAWWTASAALTALAAHDAAHAGGGPSTAFGTDWVGKYDDLLGGSNIANCRGYVHPRATLYGNPLSAAYYGVSPFSIGASAITMPYKTAVALPSSGAAVFFGGINLNGFTSPILGQATTGTTYMLACNGNTLRMGDNYTSVPALSGIVGSPNLIGWHSFGVYWDASNYQLVFEGANYGSARAFTGGIRPTTIAGMVSGTGSGGNGTGGLYTQDILCALGLFSGTGSAAEIALISAAMRAELAPAAAGTAYASDNNLLTRPTLSSWETGVPVGLPTAILLPEAKGFYRAYDFNGLAKFEGIVTVENVPSIKRVFLFDKATKLVVADTWSNAAGQYGFYNLSPLKEYFVWSEDNARVWNAVTQDMLVPSV